MRGFFHLAPALSLTGLLASGLGATTAAQHAQVSAVVPNPTNSTEIWVANRGNDSVSVVDTTTGTVVSEIAVGVWPRSIGFTTDGARAFVANQRGNVEVTKHFVTPFDGSELRGTISVIDTGTKMVVDTLTNVGTEPYGLTVAPNGAWFAVTGHRSGTVKFYDTQAPHNELLSFAYDRSLNFIAAGKTVADVDTDGDMIPDLDEPRAMVIRSDSQRIFVTHSLPGYVSVLDLTLDMDGKPTVATQNTKIDLNTYPFHPIFAPTPVQTLAAQGVPRFLDDIALSPDGTRALVPHLLHNLNHDVNHDFGPGLAGDFANRVYPALAVVDTTALSFNQGGDSSALLSHELGQTLSPAEYVPYGGPGFDTGTSHLSLGGEGSPTMGTTAMFRVSGSLPSDIHIYWWGLFPENIPFFLGNIFAPATFLLSDLDQTAGLAVPVHPAVEGMSIYLQAAVLRGNPLELVGLTNGLEAVAGSTGFTAGNLGYRAGHPGRVVYNTDGDHALLLNRGSEDVFLFDVSGSDLTLRTVFPPRKDHVERAALDTSTPLGDLPLGIALVDDASTANRDSLVYIVNETSRTLSTLRVDWDTGVISQESAQIDLLTGTDKMTASERLGQELFEDASRAQTAGNFNNSCGSCHFEGGADGNVWQRPAGPRSTMPVYGGSLLTGLILWKGVRLNMGETGPMFGGENGGTGVFNDTEQQALTDYHNIIPVPLNPNLDPVTGQYSTTAAFGKDLFFGTDDTGLNPTMRRAGCADCHPDFDSSSMTSRGYTTDFVDPMLTSGENLGPGFDPNCVSLRENFVAANIRNVNSAVNIDANMDMVIDVDRNADGFDDRETYTPMNADGADDFTRDDPNSYLCPENPMDMMSPLRSFMRSGDLFSVPTKLGAFSTGPYFHDHSVASLRTLLDPEAQVSDPKYGSASYPTVQKFFNEFHDIRGNDTHVPNSSKVQVTLDTLSSGSTFDTDIDALLEYIRSL